MDVITMPKISSLANTLASAFPGLSFEVSDDFRWSPEEKVVYYCTDEREDGASELLHETAHGLLQHAGYERDIDLLKMERDAWSYAAQELAPRFGINIEDDSVEDALDSYREWLHARSLCPHCSQTGIQTDTNTYSCLGCDESWYANEARRCALRRYKVEDLKTPAL